MINDKIKQWLSLEDQVTQSEKQLKDLKSERGKLESQIIEEMDTQELNSVKTDQGNFTIRETLYASVNKEDIESVKAFFDERGKLDGLLEEIFKKGRLNELTKEFLSTGEPIPETIKYYIKRAITKKLL